MKVMNKKLEAELSYKNSEFSSMPKALIMSSLVIGGSVFTNPSLSRSQIIMKKLLIVLTIGCLTLLTEGLEASWARFGLPDLLALTSTSRARMPNGDIRMAMPLRYKSRFPRRFVRAIHSSHDHESFRARATDAPVLNHLLRRESLRNSFLRAVTGEKILGSKQLEPSFSSENYKNFRELINSLESTGVANADVLDGSSLDQTKKVHRARVIPIILSTCCSYAIR